MHGTSKTDPWSQRRVHILVTWIRLEDLQVQFSHMERKIKVWGCSLVVCLVHRPKFNPQRHHRELGNPQAVPQQMKRGGNGTGLTPLHWRPASLSLIWPGHG